MTYYSFDPRDNIRRAIGARSDRNLDNQDEWVIEVLDDDNDTVYIPLLLPEETRSDTPYNMPYVELLLISSPARVHNIQGDVREQEAYIDLNIWYTNTDGISATSFGKRIADELVNQIMTYRHSVVSVDWVEVNDDGRELVEPTGTQVFYHRVVGVYAKKYG